MRVNTVSLITPAKTRSVGFLASTESTDGRSNVADAFPLGVEVKSTYNGGEQLVRITFPEAEPLPSEIAKTLVSDETLAYKRNGNCLQRVWDIENVKAVDALILRTEEAVKNVADYLREFVQARSQARIAELAANATEVAKNMA